MGTCVVQSDLTKTNILFNSWVYTGHNAESTHSNFCDVAMHIACGTHGREQLQWLKNLSPFRLACIKYQACRCSFVNCGWCHYICHCIVGPFFSHIITQFWAHGVLGPVSPVQFASDLQVFHTLNLKGSVIKLITKGDIDPRKMLSEHIHSSVW